MRKSKIAVAGLALVLFMGLSGTAIAQDGSAETACSSNRTYVQDDPNRRDTDVSVDGDEDDDSWMTRQQVARIVLYDPADLSGRRIGITRDTPDLGERDFADIASSIRVYGGTWELCEEVNYGGTCRCFSSHTNVNRFGLGNPVTDASLEAENFNDRVSSIRLVRSNRR